MDGSARSAWRRRIPAVLVAFACVAGVVIAVTGAARPLPALQFLPVGHWVYNSSSQRAYHVDGGGGGVDEGVPVPGEPNSQVVQGDDDGFVVGNGRVTQFGKSTLSVDPAQPVPAGEIPYGVETVGGPYLVYPGKGSIVRLGDPLVAMSTGGSTVGRPAVTAAGTVWVLRQGNGVICKVDRGADHVVCPAVAPPGHTGGLTVIGDRPTFIDTTASTAATVTDGGLAPAVSLGTTVAPDAIPAPNDVAGKVALLQPRQHTMSFVSPGNAAQRPVTVQLPPSGDYAGPESNGSAVAVVDQQSRTLLTFGPDGNRLATRPIPKPAAGQAANAADTRLSRGEDNKLYLDDPDGSHVLVVGDDGAVTDVPVLSTGPGNKPGPGRQPAPGRNTPTPGRAPDPGANPNPEPGGQSNPADQSQPDPGNSPSPAGNDTGPAKSKPPSPSNPGPQRPPTRQQPPPDNPQPPANPKPPSRPQKPPTAPASRPGAPPGVTAAAGNASVTVRWGAAADNSARITQYVVTVRSSAGTRTTKVAGTARSATLGSLTGGTQYTASVQAVNSAGAGPVARSAPVTVVGKAGAPGVTATASGTTATVHWSTPNLGGGSLVGYRITGSGGLGTRTVNGTSASYPGLTPGSTYTFTVSAVTMSPSGGQLTGAAGSDSVRVPPTTTPPAAKPTIVATVGDLDDEADNCDVEDNCREVDVKLTGFTPGTTVRLDAMRMRGGSFDNTEVRIRADGTGSTDDLDVDNGNPSFYVEGGGVRSATINWE